MGKALEDWSAASLRLAKACDWTEVKDAIDAGNAMRDQLLAEVERLRQELKDVLTECPACAEVAALKVDFNDLGERCGAAESALYAARDEFCGDCEYLPRPQREPQP